MMVAGDGPFFCTQYIDVEETQVKTEKARRNRRKTPESKLKNTLAQQRYRDRKRIESRQKDAEIELLRRQNEELRAEVAYWKARAAGND
jgi:hypothetical protein